MVFYSTKSREKVFHLPHCRIIHRIRKPYRKQFATAEEARAAGYRMCSCCSPVGIRLRREQEAVNRLSQENGLSCRLKDGQLHVYTRQSKWRIIVSGKNNKLFLYHKNTCEKPEKIPSRVPGYHSQAVRCDTIAGYLDYIAQHDSFWWRQAKRARQKAGSMHHLQKNTHPYRRGQERRRFNANQLYSVMDSVSL